MIGVDIKADIHSHGLRQRLWLNSWLVAGVVLILSWLYQLAAGEEVSWFSFSKTLAGTGGVLIAASFVLSGFCYYFDFLDTKLGYRKYLGLIGYYFALAYTVSLVWFYPEYYGYGLAARWSEPEVILGLIAMAILTVMAISSNTKIMLALGPVTWRACLRLGYLAMALFVVRAYLLESDLWFNWLSSLQGLPPGRLVLSVIVLGVISLRGSMIISQHWKKNVALSATATEVKGNIVLWLVAVGAIFILLLWLAYHYLTIRPVITPRPVAQPVGDLAPLPADNQEAENSAPIALTSDAELSYLTLPAGFAINIFARDIYPAALSRPGPALGPRLMLVKAENIFVAVPGRGSIMVWQDKTGDGRADWQQDFITGLKRPHNLDYHEGWYYIASEDSIIRVRDDDNDLRADMASVEHLVSLPSGGHWTRTVKIIDNKMYFAMGSSCNVCQETDQRRAALTRCDLTGTNCTFFARGLRNTVDFIAYKGVIYGTDNGRDQLGNNLPPDEVNLITEGGDYGWPSCYGQQVHDTNYDKNIYLRNPCADTIGPLVELLAHIAPLGLEFYQGKDFPVEYQGNLFVAAHGSWNRQPPDGYKIYRVDWQTKEVSDFIGGWLAGTVVRGRPVGIVNYKNGLLISDDAAGIIYYVRYSP